MEPLRILVVDDEEDLVSTLAERLALRGFQVETATRGDDALRYVAGGDFNVLILDVKMPGIDGLELMGQIRQKRPDLPIILFTGQASTADAERGMREGACDYVLKPVDLDDLIDKITSAADSKRGRNR